MVRALSRRSRLTAGAGRARSGGCCLSGSGGRGRPRATSARGGDPARGAHGRHVADHSRARSASPGGNALAAGRTPAGGGDMRNRASARRCPTRLEWATPHRCSSRSAAGWTCSCSARARAVPCAASCLAASRAMSCTARAAPLFSLDPPAAHASSSKVRPAPGRAGPAQPAAPGCAASRPRPRRTLRGAVRRGCPRAPVRLLYETVRASLAGQRRWGSSAPGGHRRCLAWAHSGPA